MSFKLSKCPGLVLVHRDARPYDMFSDDLEYVLMFDRCWLPYDRGVQLPIGGPLDQVQEVSALLSSSDVDWTTDIATRVREDLEFAQTVKDALASVVEKVQESHD